MESKIAKLEKAAEVLRERLKRSVQENGISAYETVTLSQKLDTYILKIQTLKILNKNIAKNAFRIEVAGIVNDSN